MTAFDRALDAYGLALEIDSAVSHFVSAIVCILLGVFDDAHRELWRAQLTAVKPAEENR